MLKSKGIGPTDANLKRTTKSLEFLKIFISNTVIFFNLFFLKLPRAKATDQDPSMMGAVENKSMVPELETLQFKHKTKIKQSKITPGVYKRQHDGQ